VFELRKSLAYSLDNWGGFMSMLFYMLTYLLFLDVLFGKVRLIAGYNHTEMLFFTLIIQVNYYLMHVFTAGNIDALDEGINTGQLDLWLVKPVPSLWFVTFRNINLGFLLLNAFPAIVPTLVVLFGKWSGFSMSVGGVMAGLVCMFLGQIIIP
jgi:ABC-2 type transport system permease protein